MSNPYQLVVFDWEGTISDTLGLILHTVTAEANALGFGSVEPAEAKKYVELGLVHALKKLFPRLTLSQQEILLQAIHRAMVSRPSEVCLIPGARELILQLQEAHIDLAIASNKGQQSLQRALQITRLDDVFKVIRCAGQLPAKPCPQMLEEIMNVFGQNAQSTLMIGDSPTDIEMARQLHVPAIGIDFYNQNAQALQAAGALAVFNNYYDVAHFLCLPLTCTGSNQQ
ncbi:MAG: HAD family hydrolase [Legionella sp.]|nr:MAG: HAD family hydrolase [Legionella sp.]PJD98577.1 MAG: HAD family hydrolase [Legionella sp.]